MFSADHRAFGQQLGLEVARLLQTTIDVFAAFDGSDAGLRGLRRDVEGFRCRPALGDVVVELGDKAFLVGGR
jgi:hypothetical protein